MDAVSRTRELLRIMCDKRDVTLNDRAAPGFHSVTRQIADVLAISECDVDVDIPRNAASLIPEFVSWDPVLIQMEIYRKMRDWQHARNRADALNECFYLLSLMYGKRKA